MTGKSLPKTRLTRSFGQGGETHFMFAASLQAKARPIAASSLLRKVISITAMVRRLFTAERLLQRTLADQALAAQSLKMETPRRSPELCLWSLFSTTTPPRRWPLFEVLGADRIKTGNPL